MRSLWLAGLLALTACQAQVETSPVETEAKVETEERKTLPLPPFPEWPAPVSSFSEDGVVYFPTKSPYDFSRVLTGYDDLSHHSGKGTLVLPEGASADNPVPAMVILHGSGGIKEGREFTYANWFAENGIAGFVVDYYEPRGVTEETPYVMKTMAATEVDIIADAYAALELLGTHPAIDKSRIGVTGYSYGGMATRYTMDARIKEIMAPDVPPFALHMDIYGPCHQNTGSWETTGAPYLQIYGDKDNSVNRDDCANVTLNLSRAEKRGDIEVLIIPGAGHAWENTAPKGEFGGAYIRGCEFSWHPETGVFLVDGKAGRFQPKPDMTRDERAFVRSTLGELVGTCVGQGYTVGNDPDADRQSKAKQLEFMRQHFGLKKETPSPDTKPHKPDSEKIRVMEMPAFKLPKPKGVYSYKSTSPIGTRSRTTLLAHRMETDKIAVATLQIDGQNDSTLMDIAFDCAEDKYRFLHIEPSLTSINDTQIVRVQNLSSAQITAFDRGEALQRLRFFALDTVPPEDIGSYRVMMNLSCQR